jgi:hypothetical protein
MAGAFPRRTARDLPCLEVPAVAEPWWSLSKGAAPPGRSAGQIRRRRNRYLPVRAFLASASAAFCAASSVG